MAEKLKCIEVGIIGHSRVVRSAPMSEKDAKDWSKSFEGAVFNMDSIYLTSRDIYIPAHAVAWIEIVDYNGEQE